MNVTLTKSMITAALATLVAVLSALLPGCGSDGGPASSLPPHEQYQQKVYLIGEIKDPSPGESAGATAQISALKGPADAVKQVFVSRVPYDGLASDAPVFIAADRVLSLSDTVKKGLLATYRKSYPIILVRGGEAEINALLGILDRDQNYKLPENFPYAELFAASMELAGNFRLSVFPPGSSDSAYSPVSLAATSADTPESLLQRAGALRDWIGKSGTRTMSKELADFRANAKTVLADVSKSDITDLVTSEYDDTYFTDTQYGANTYLIKYYSYPVHQFNADSKGKEYDWLYVVQTADLAGRNRYDNYKQIHSLTEEEKKWIVSINPLYLLLGANDIDIVHYVSRYAISNILDKSLSSQVAIQDSSPATVNHQTKTTSGLKFDLTGEFGLKTSTKAGEEGEGSASTSGTLSFSKETEVIIDDCEITNNSVSKNSSDASWTYNFQLATQRSQSIAFAKMNAPVNLSINSFKPANKWIWRFDPSVRESTKQFKTDFEAENMISLSTFSIFGVPVDPPTHVTESVFKIKNYPRLFFPPVIVAPARNLVLDSSKAQYKTMDVSVGRDWTAASDQVWCRVAPISGKGNNPKFSITADENPLGTERKATITFRTYDYKESPEDNKYKQDTMIVTQPPKL